MRADLAVESRRGGERGEPGSSSLDLRIARRLALLRAERGWSLDTLAVQTGISRASLSRLERGELSPTASMLGALCTQYGWTLSRLMADAESGPPAVVRGSAQVTWKDPASGYLRRIISPPHQNLRGELVEISLPSGASVAYDASPMPGLEHHLWMLEGSVNIEIEGTSFRVEKGDCVRYVLAGSSRFECRSKRPARYLVALVHP